VDSPQAGRISTEGDEAATHGRASHGRHVPEFHRAQLRGRRVEPQHAVDVDPTVCLERTEGQPHRARGTTTSGAKAMSGDERAESRTAVPRVVIEDRVTPLNCRATVWVRGSERIRYRTLRPPAMPAVPSQGARWPPYCRSATLNRVLHGQCVASRALRAPPRAVRSPHRRRVGSIVTPPSPQWSAGACARIGTRCRE
jgi:hypothetical protein